MILDVGHTAEVPGATSARGAAEYTFNLRLAREIKQTLVDAGFVRTVLLVTAGPTRAGLVKRVARANRSPADLFLSIHHDSVPDRFLETWQYEGRERYFSDRFKGHSIFVSYENPERRASQLFGKLLGDQLKERGLQYASHYTQAFMGHRRRELVDAEAGVYRYDQLIVLKDTRMPAVLLEAGSIINRDEELEMDSVERRSLIAGAVSDAVEKFCAARPPGHPAELHAGAARPAKQAVRGTTQPANPRR
jgi:N-acetylmuramoyl-L-alanine amidase